MSKSLKWLIAALMIGAPLTAEAHRAWLLPSATVLSGDNLWVTVDAAVSNDLFYFEHFPLRIVGFTPPQAGMPAGRGRGAELKITAPDGTAIEAKNGTIGRYRSTFDLPLEQKGTYRIAVTNQGVFASYKQGAETKRWSGTVEAFAKEVPAGAEALQANYNQSRIETFVTSGSPTKETLKTSGVGLELAPITHPNDLVAGTEAVFALLLDGKPAAGVNVTIVPGGNRYRDKLGDVKLTTGADGKFSVTWPEPGMYWLEASVRDDKVPAKEFHQRRAGYIATLEVLPP